MRRQLSQKDANSSAFLDKFLGKTSKIGKKGISGVIAEARNQAKIQMDSSKLSSMYRIERNRDHSDNEERKVSLNDIIREQQRDLQGQLVSSRVRIQSKSSDAHNHFSRDSVYSQKQQKQQCQRNIDSMNSVRTELKSSKFGHSNKRPDKPKYMYQTLLNGDAMRQFQLLTLIEQRFKLKS